ncbi:MAG: asparagine synthase (glutamine-hydrolyzing) [Planctomycetales bacterium]|nr:asparagine synthase (glutamine-hydrolyzing) [Planctomycetales bacterium]
MCGIAGIAPYSPKDSPSESTLVKMAHALHHRGPDDQGVWSGLGCGLSMSRLAVVDVVDGKQPVANEDETVFAVFNGEIYNHKELSDQLRSRGHKLPSRCDAEVIVHLYEEHGIEFVKHLRGMFAIALWDSRQRTLFLIRDRLGVKPLYYHIGKSGIVFGSEIKAVLQEDGVPREPDLTAIDHLIRFGHFAPESSPFLGICEVPPATVLSFRSGVVNQSCYWDLTETIESARSSTTPYNPHDAVTQLREHIADSISERLHSDVPLGAFLSGGIDSSLIVALMSALRSEPFDTFTIGFDDDSFDERPYARAIADEFGTRHHELVVKPDVERILPELIRHHDTPFYDTSAIPMYYLSDLARQHVTVALSGDGGDELFAGYNIFSANRAATLYRRLPQSIRDCVARCAKWIPESSNYVNRGRVAREFLVATDLQPIERYARWNSKIKFETRNRLYRHEQLRDRLHHSDVLFLSDEYCQFTNATDLDRQLYIAMRHELACDMLVKVDRMSMAHGLEVRSPLLSHRLFEFAAALPDKAKIKRFHGKALLRDVAEQVLPKQIVRRPKRGFSVPLDRWLRTSLRDFSATILLESKTRQRELFHTNFVESMLKEHSEGCRNWGREIWTMLTIELWFRMYIDAQPSVSQHTATISPTISLTA